MQKKSVIILPGYILRLFSIFLWICLREYGQPVGLGQSKMYMQLKTQHVHNLPKITVLYCYVKTILLLLDIFLYHFIGEPLI